MAKAKEAAGEEKDPLKKLLETLNSKYGKGSIINGKDIPRDVETVPTGSIALDIATSIKGNPRGKLIEMFGPESSGKSTLALHFIAEFQKAGSTCMLVDSEYSFDKAYAEAIGVDTSKLIYSQPECMEDAYNIMETVIKSKQVQFIVFDSHTSCLPKKVIEGEVGDATMALSARINSTALGKIKPLLKPYNVTLLGISQLRTNIGGYGDPNVPTGGMAWKFYTDMRYKVSKSADKTKEQNKTTVEVIKNKCGVPFGKAEFMIRWGVGIDRQQEIIDYAVDQGLLKLAGAGWYTVDESTKIQGDANMKQFLLDNPEYAESLEKQVFQNLRKKNEEENVEVRVEETEY